MMTEDKYYIKYLKYKNLYLELNKQLGGGGNAEHNIRITVAVLDIIIRQLRETEWKALQDFNEDTLSRYDQPSIHGTEPVNVELPI